jgi:hypothetical protein
MFVLLIVAIAGIALVATVMITRRHARDRRDRLARQTAAAQARAEAQARAVQAREQRRRALAGADDELTSVIPAIRMPWPKQLSAPREQASPDLDGEYPQFSTLAPFQATPADAPWPPAGRGRPGPWEDGRLVPPRPEPAEPAGPAPYPADPAAPAAWGERLRPAPPQDGCMAPTAVPTEYAEYTAAVPRARRRPTHGTHRGGHARRRRG